MDGVLMNTNDMHFGAWRETLKKYDIEFSQQDYNQCLGLSREMQMELICKINGIELPSELKIRIMAEKNRLVEQAVARLTVNDVDPDVLQTLAALRKKGIRTALASSSKNARNIMNNTTLVNYLDVLCDGNQIKNAKPDPEVFLLAWSQLNIDKKDCLIVEDAPAGIDAAIAAGIDACGLGEARTYPKTKIKIRKVSDILKHLGS